MRTVPDDTSRLTDVIAELSATESLEQVTAVVTHAVRTLVGADGATFVIRADGKCHYVDEDAISPLWKGHRFPLSACLSGWAMLNRDTAVIPDIYADDRIPHDVYRPTFVKSLAMAPVRRPDPIAAIGAYWREERMPTAAEVRTLEILANSSAVALENLELRGSLSRRISERDELEAAIHTVAHDLRSPLGTMLGYAELLEDLVEDSQQATFARTIRQAGERLSTQIDKMLAVYRVTSQPIEPARVDLSVLAQQVVEDQLRRAGDRSVTATVRPGLVAVADPALAHLMFENLIGNAFKYSGRAPHAEISVTGTSADGVTTVVVADNGAGFDPADADRLFHPLTRLHHTRDFEGTGLGLASVARIVALHGGTITATGSPGKGATFTVTLPSR